MDLAKKILSDPINRWLFSRAGKDIFLVGGYIRDLLRDVDINKDMDYVLKDNIKVIALSTSRKFKGTFIELKKDQMFRIVLKNGQFLDFSQLQNTILEDLGKRDFSINAIAWSPEKGLIDPFDGMTDIRNKKIRVIKPENLAEDPLRVLRAYRLAAQSGFTIDMYTRNYLKKYASNIKETAPERITDELFKILITTNASYYISMSEKDKVLYRILDVTSHKIKLNMAMLVKFDNFIKRLRNGKYKKLFNYRMLPFLNLNIGQGLNRSGLIRLSILLNNLYSRANENKCGKLKFSKSIMKRVRNIQDGIMLSAGRISQRKLFDIFKAAEECEYEAALLVSVVRQRNVDKFLKRADDFVKFKKNPLLDGYKIQNILNIDPSEKIGEIQDEIHKRRFLGITRTKAEAKNWLLSNFT